MAASSLLLAAPPVPGDKGSAHRVPLNAGSGP